MSKHSIIEQLAGVETVAWPCRCLKSMVAQRWTFKSDLICARPSATSENRRRRAMEDRKQTRQSGSNIDGKAIGHFENVTCKTALRKSNWTEQITRAQRDPRAKDKVNQKRRFFQCQEHHATITQVRICMLTAVLTPLV